MNKSQKYFSVKECKIQASILLKSLYFDDCEKSRQAAKRFQRLSEFKKLSLDEIIKTDIKHKTALAVVATEKGFSSWAELKHQLPLVRGGFLNHWFADYQQAKAYLKSQGGFLLPYKKQFFVCEAEYINNLGFSFEDPDWQLIGYDWINPDNQKAWIRLYKKWLLIQKISDK